MGGPPNIDDFKPHVCEVCGYPEFEQTYRVLKKSKFISETGQDEYIHTIALRCEYCKWLLGMPVSEEDKAKILDHLNKMKDIPTS
jgi:predicted nucleic-acid-binding Zn-ribbon protein